MTPARGGRHRVLVLRALGLGDLLTAVPALRALRRALPEHGTTVAMPAPLAPLLRLAGLDAGVQHHTGLDVPLGVAPVEVGVNLHGRGPQSHRLLLDVAERVVAFGNDEAGVPGPVWREDEHERVRWCRLVEESLGVVADPDDVLLVRPARPPSVAGAVVVHPGAAYGSRRWPPERFAAVAAALASTGVPVVVTGGAAERRLADRVARLAGLPAGAVLAGSTDVTDLAALVSHARLVVCGDTGVAHLASAYGVPSVVLFGPTPPLRWGPPRGPHEVIWYGADRSRPGEPMGQRPDEALLAVTPEEVTARSLRLLTERPEARAGAPGSAAAAT